MIHQLLKWDHRAYMWYISNPQLTFLFEHLNLQVFNCRIFEVFDSVVVRAVVIVTETARIKHLLRWKHIHTRTYELLSSAFIIMTQKKARYMCRVCMDNELFNENRCMCLRSLSSSTMITLKGHTSQSFFSFFQAWHRTQFLVASHTPNWA